MAYANLSDLLQVEPNIQEYGVIEWDSELSRSETELNRVLTVRWWQGYRRNLGLGDTAQLDISLLDNAQWTQATVYHALAYHICPKLSQFSPDKDKFQVMMDYYRGRFEHEMDLCLREGVRYDADDSGTFADTEKLSDRSLRLRR